MPDIFDLASTKQDVFDKISGATSGKKDIFDSTVKTDPFLEKYTIHVKLQPERQQTLQEAIKNLGPPIPSNKSLPEKKAPPPEIAFDPKTGKYNVNVPPSAAVGFFEDPITSAIMGSVVGAKAAGSLGSKIFQGLREALGWQTGGLSEVPGLAKGGAEALIRGASAKNLEETMSHAALRAEKGIGVKSADVAETGIKGVASSAEKTLENITQKNTPSRSDMVKKIEETFNIPIRTGRSRLFSKNTVGIYKEIPEVIRLKQAADIPTLIHESGHHIQKILGFSGDMPKEIQKMAYAGAKDVNKEGFAEFVKYYVTKPNVAQKQAPTFYKEFEKSLEANPDIRGLFTNLREDWRSWQALPAEQKVASYIRSGSEIKKSKGPILKRFYRSVIDEFNPIKDLVKTAEKATGKEIPIDKDPFKLAWLTRGWAKKAEQFLKYGTFRETPEGIKFTGDSLKSILKPFSDPEKLKRLDTYLVAKRALHDKRIIEGFAGQLTKDNFAETVAKGKKEFEPVAKKLYKYQSELLRYFVDSGRISQTAADKMAKTNLFYAPLYRVLGEKEGLGSVTKAQFSKVPEVIKRLKGNASDIYSPTENMVYNTFAMINVAERNKVGLAIADFSRVKGIGKYIERVPVKLRPTKISEEEIKRLIPDLKDAGDISLKDIYTIFRPSKALEKGEVVFYRNGRPEHYIMGDKGLYDAITGLDGQSMHFIIKALAYPAKWLRTGATLSPEFILRNPIRDQFTAYVYSKYGYKPFWDAGRGIFHILKKDKIYQLYNSSGAAHAALVSLDRNYLSKGLKELLKNPDIKELFTKPLKSFQVVSELMEEATRVSEFRRALEKEGMTPAGIKKAAIASRDVTLDFARIGAHTKAYNAITAFQNAQVQGLDKMVRAFKDNPVKTSFKAAAGITLPSVILWNVNKDDPYYQELPDWRKTLFWNFVIHKKDGSLKTVISIPRPFELGILFGAGPEAALNWAYKKDKAGMKSAGKQLWQALSPGIIPTGPVPVVEWFANRSMFFDRPISPRGKEGLSPYLQYAKRTSETMKLTAKGMSKIPLLNAIANPAKMENLFRGWTGNLGYLTLQGSDAMLKTLGIVKPPTKPSMTLADIPGIRGFVGHFPSSTSKSIEDFYRIYKKKKTRYEDAKAKLGVRGLGLKMKTPTYLKDMQDTAASLSALRKVANLIYKSKLDPKAKRIALNKTYLLMINTARKALGKKIIKMKLK